MSLGGGGGGGLAKSHVIFDGGGGNDNCHRGVGGRRKSAKKASTVECAAIFNMFERVATSELNVDNWNDNCEAKSEAKSPRPLRGFQVDSSLTRNVPYAVR